MAAILLLAILVSGFIICSIHPKLKITLHKFEGQLLYLHVARLGFTCVICSFLLVGTISCLLSHKFPVLCVPHILTGETHCAYDIDLDYIRKISELLIYWELAVEGNLSELYAFFVVVSIVAVILPYPWKAFDTRRIEWWWGLNSGVKAGAYYTRLACKDDMIALALIEACVRREPLLISMTDRKVYVGVVSELSPPSEVHAPNEEFCLIPIFSGYRDEKTLEIFYTTQYKETHKVPIIMMQSSIVSLSFFDPTVRAATLPTSAKSDQTSVIVPDGAN